ncbi:uncharacterized protein [Halyomorpha halys]|uniref:uncharacterized protein n=1 Tax=Halyomorpha halys TaxID=286706 RepID=UPI0006D527A1|nr:uncharacterized protein LOC106692682 [Halyomorpha halys]
MMRLFSKVAMAYPVRDKSAEAVLTALRTWFQFYGVPNRISSDGGRKFDNVAIWEEMRILEVTWHLNTPGHPKNRGGTERLHSTRSDHLWVYQVDKCLEPDEVMTKAITAYYHSIYTVTGFALFEILFGIRARRRDHRGATTEEGEILNNGQALRTIWTKVKGRIEREKSKRMARHNLNITDMTEAIKIGMIFYRKLNSNREEEVQCYEGPFRITEMRENNIVTIERLTQPRKRRTVHIEQLTLTAAAASLGVEVPSNHN